jgi:hypothetical protein
METAKIIQFPRASFEENLSKMTLRQIRDLINRVRKEEGDNEAEFMVCTILAFISESEGKR